MFFYLLPPATKLGQGNIFRSACQEFCSQVGGLPHCMLGYKPPRTRPPPGSRHPPQGADTPKDQKPPVTRQPPRPDTSPQSSACWEMWATSGWYTSYWNAYLFQLGPVHILPKQCSLLLFVEFLIFSPYKIQHTLNIFNY